ncbi:hypothetical protein Bca101_012984 [Brassica carinata]
MFHLMMTNYQPVSSLIRSVVVDPFRRRHRSIPLSSSLSLRSDQDFRVAEVFCVCGQWNSNESLHWEFSVDRNRNASSIYLEENLQYEDLIKMVSEDFNVKEEKICLSYGFCWTLKALLKVFPQSP